MKKWVFRSIGLSLTIGFVGAAAPGVSAAETAWQTIPVPPGPHAVEFNGQTREIFPGCVFPGDNYVFHFKPGAPDKLLVFFNGGGACWNSATCLASLQSSTPAYVPTTNISFNQPQGQKGVFDSTRADNPYKDWSLVFLPYCSGDVHLGSTDVMYPLGGGVAAPIRHRGFDNFLYARQWIAQQFPAVGPNAVTKLLIAGESAGAYGAAFNYPHLKQLFPNARGYLFADAGNGVFTNDFINTTLNGPNAVWGIQNNFAPFMAAAPTLGAQNAMVYAYTSLANQYPADRFSQYTAGWDVIQPLFYNIMLNPENPAVWPNVTPGLMFDWRVRMQSFAFRQAASPNYRFYIAPGCDHGLLRSDNFYSSRRVAGLSAREWTQGLTQEAGTTPASWRNVTCNPLTECPFPATEIPACLRRATPTL